VERNVLVLERIKDVPPKEIRNGAASGVKLEYDDEYQYEYEYALQDLLMFPGLISSVPPCRHTAIGTDISMFDVLAETRKTLFSDKPPSRRKRIKENGCRNDRSYTYPHLRC